MASIQVARGGVITAIGAALLILAGCSTSAPGVNDTVGTYDRTVNAPAATVGHATESVLGDYKFPIDSHSITDYDGQFTAHTAQGAEIHVSISRVSDDSAKVSIRVGTTGDEGLSQEILGKINDKATSLGAKVMGTVRGDQP